MQLYWNHTSTWCSSVNLLHIFRTFFYKNTCGGLLLDFWRHCLNTLLLSFKFLVASKSWKNVANKSVWPFHTVPHFKYQITTSIEHVIKHQVILKNDGISKKYKAYAALKAVYSKVCSHEIWRAERKNSADSIETNTA